jgi:hypothetical protein
VIHLVADKAVPGQPLFDGTHGPAAALDWSGMTDVQFIVNSFGILALATLLGTLIGYHPATRRKIGGLHEADMPHVYVMYAVIGAVMTKYDPKMSGYGYGYGGFYGGTSTSLSTSVMRKQETAVLKSNQLSIMTMLQEKSAEMRRKMTLKYKVEFWHEKLGKAKGEVTIKDDGTCDPLEMKMAEKKK